MRVTRNLGLKLLVGGAAVLIAAPMVLASDFHGRRTVVRQHTVVRERVIGPAPVVTHVVHRVPPAVVVHRPPARVVSYETHIVQAPRVIAPPPVRTEVVVQSDGWCDRIKPADVDIDSLKPELRFDRREGQWWLEVRYKVEVKYAPNGQFDLVVDLMDQGTPVVDERGEPVRFAVVLDRPTDVDDHELEYKGRFEVPLPAGAAFHPKKLRAHALVMDRENGAVLDAKTKSVDLDD